MFYLRLLNAILRDCCSSFPLLTGRRCSENGGKAGVGDHDVMVPDGSESSMASLGGLCQTAINKLHATHHPRSTSFVPRRPLGLQTTQSSVVLAQHAIATRGSSASSLHAPAAALPLAFDWLFLGPELSCWLVFVLITFIFAPVTQGWLQISRASCPVLRLGCLLQLSCGQCRPLLGYGTHSPLAPSGLRHGTPRR